MAVHVARGTRADTLEPHPISRGVRFRNRNHPSLVIVILLVLVIDYDYDWDLEAGFPSS